MEAVLKLPVDLLGLPAFRELKVTLGGEHRTLGEQRALMAWVVLWLELHYRAQEGKSSGRLEAAERQSVVNALGPAVGLDGEQVFDLMVQASLLKLDGDGWVCPRFCALYGGGGNAVRTMAQRGGDMRAYQAKMKNTEAGLFQLSLQVDGAKFVDEQGQPLEAELVKKVTWLVKACDNALFKPERPTVCWTEGLIQAALKVVRARSTEEMQFGCRLVAGNRNHPALSGMIAEKLLPRFEEVLTQLTAK